VRRALGLLLLLLAALGCGRETGNELSAEQFEQLDRVLRVEIDDRDVLGGGDGLERVREACSGLDRDDPLLAAQRDQCFDSIEFAKAFAGLRCDGSQECARALAVALEATGRTADLAGRVEDAVADADLEEDCAETLAPEGFEDLMLDLKEVLGRAAAARDRAAEQAALRDLRRIVAELDRYGTSKQLHRRFRAACSP
jgi:hypothetical protein